MILYQQVNYLSCSVNKCVFLLSLHECNSYTVYNMAQIHIRSFNYSDGEWGENQILPTDCSLFVEFLQGVSTPVWRRDHITIASWADLCFTAGSHHEHVVLWWVEVNLEKFTCFSVMNFYFQFYIYILIPSVLVFENESILHNQNFSPVFIFMGFECKQTTAL